MNKEQSPYSNVFGVAYDDGDVSLERIESTYSPSTDDVNHTVLEGQTLQSIAFQYYGDSGLWSLLADANNIYNPFTEVTTGLLIIIPHGKL